MLKRHGMIKVDLEKEVEKPKVEKEKKKKKKGLLKKVKDLWDSL